MYSTNIKNIFVLYKEYINIMGDTEVPMKRFVIFGYESEPADSASTDGTPATYTADVYMSKNPIDMKTFNGLLTNISQSITTGNVVLDDKFEFISSALSSDNFGGLVGVLKTNNSVLNNNLSEKKKGTVVQNYITSILNVLGIGPVPTGDALENFHSTYTTPDTVNATDKPKLVKAIDILSQYDKWLNARGYTTKDSTESSTESSKPRNAYNKLKDVVDKAIVAYNKQDKKAMMGGSQTRSLRKKMSSKQRRGTQRRL
jgi:hypothetical protein